MRIIQNEFFMELFADDGMVLTDGETFSKDVCLGKYDFPHNWDEVPEGEAEQEADVTE